jgi:translation initiation factor IF-1
MASKNEIIAGQITEALPNTMFKIELENGQEALAVPSGKMRRGYMRLMPGAKVKVEFTPYDKKRGRIVAKIK